MAAFKVDDGKTTEAKGDKIIEIRAFVVWASMDDTILHRLKDLFSVAWSLPLCC
jgi:hypothetical protein